MEKHIDICFYTLSSIVFFPLHKQIYL